MYSLKFTIFSLFDLIGSSRKSCLLNPVIAHQSGRVSLRSRAWL